VGEWAMEEPGSLSMVPRVRAWVRGVLANCPPGVVDDVELIASEYVTNSVRHSRAAEGDPVNVSLIVKDGRVRLEVRDGGPRRAKSGDWTEEEIGNFGRGLLIAAEIADDMGEHSGPDGRLAWAELRK
jgi:anti-sigma regulatory factor (Ser/Thr protein kinase)